MFQKATKPLKNEREKAQMWNFETKTTISINIGISLILKK